MSKHHIEQLKVVLITGASSGIGRACAQRLAANGYRVYGTSRSVETESQGEDRSGNSFRMIRMDVLKEESVKNAVKQVIELEGRLDIVVNNAGISIHGTVEDLTIDEHQRVFDTNYFGMIRTCQAVLPILRKQNKGMIINIGSLGGLVGIPFDGAYSASKFAMEGLTQALRMEVRKFNIGVCVIEPGDIDTGMSSRSSSAVNFGKDSVYYEDTKKSLKATADNEMKGASPENIAILLEKIITASTIKFRNPGGSFLDKISGRLLRVLPNGLIEDLIMRNYGIK